MAQIPLGEFALSRVTPRADTTRVDMSPTNVAGRGAAAVGDALSNVGQQLGQQAIQAKAKESQEAENLARAKAANATADYNLLTEMATADVEDQLRTGTLDYTKAPEALDSVLSKIEVPQIEGLHPDTQETYSGGMGRIRQAAGLKIQGAVVSARRDDGQKQAAQLIDTAGKRAALRGANIDEIAAQLRGTIPGLQKFGLDASKLQTAVDNKIENMYVTQASTRANDAAQDITALKALQHDLTADDGAYADKIDGDKRAAMGSSVAAHIDRVMSAARIDADKRETVAAGAVKDAWEQAMSGLPPPPELVASWDVATKDTSQAAAFQQAMQQGVVVRKVAMMPGSLQTEWLDAQDAALQKQGTPEQQTMLGHARKAIESMAQTRKEDPVGFSAVLTGKEPASISVADLTPDGMAKIGTVLADRMATLSAMNKQGYAVDMKPLRKNEVEQFQAAIAGMPPDNLLKLYAPLRASAGSDRAYAAVMQQLAPDAPLKAYAGELAVRPGGMQAAQLVLRGEALLAGKGDQKWTVPGDAKFMQAFVEESGNAYQGRGEALTRDLAAARAAYAAAGAQDGDTDSQTEFNENRFQTAMLAVRGHIADVGGVKTVAPWGVDADDFEDRAPVQMREALVAAGLDESPSGVGLMLSRTVPGRYILVHGSISIKNPKVAGDIPVMFDYSTPRAAPVAKPNRPAAYDATVKGTR